MSESETKPQNTFEAADKSQNKGGLCQESLQPIEPFLKFLYQKWWKVEFFGLDRVPEQGSCLIVGNQGSLIPWQALMLLYAFKNHLPVSRRLYILTDMDSIKDPKLKKLFSEIGFRDWSSANMKELFEQGELVAIFPEGIKGLSKPFSQRYRLEEFDWTMLLPAVESGVEILPLAALGFDEACPKLIESKLLSSLIKLSTYAIPKRISWLPSPFSLLSAPVEVSLNLLKPAIGKECTSRDEIEDAAQSTSLWIQGEIQAELNRQLRHRSL